MTGGYGFFLGLMVGLAVMGAVWAILYNRRFHPGKLEHQLEESVDKVRQNPKTVV